MITWLSQNVLLDLIKSMQKRETSSNLILAGTDIYIFGRRNQSGHFTEPGVAIVHKDMCVTEAFYDFLRRNQEEAMAAGRRKAAKIALTHASPPLNQALYACAQKSESVLYDIIQVILLPHEWHSQDAEHLAQFTHHTPFDLVFWKEFLDQQIHWRALEGTTAF